MQRHNYTYVLHACLCELNDRPTTRITRTTLVGPVCIHDDFIRIYLSGYRERFRMRIGICVSLMFYNVT